MSHIVNRRAGFTLVEVVLAVAISAMVGLVVAGMLGGLGNAIRAETDTRRAIIKRQVAIARLGAFTRGAAMVLNCNDQSLVLWRGDITGDSLPNLSELRRVDYDTDTGEVWVYQSPDNLDPALDETYAMSDDFIAITASQAGSVRFPGQRILANVAQWDLAIENSSPQATRWVRMDLVLEQEGVADAATVVSALRIAPN